MVTNAAAFATYSNQTGLHEVLQSLGQMGFNKESIFMFLSPSHPFATRLRESCLHAFDPAAGPATTGLIGWLSDLGAVVIPTFGFFIRSREFYQAWVMNQEPAGRSAGNLARLGFSPEDAERFGQSIREVGALLYVSCPENRKPQKALELLCAKGAQESGVLEPQPALRAAAHAA